MHKRPRLDILRDFAVTSYAKACVGESVCGVMNGERKIGVCLSHMHIYFLFPHTPHPGHSTVVSEVLKLPNKRVEQTQTVVHTR